jgi:hypothetical protein
MAEILSLRRGSCVWYFVQDDKFSSCVRGWGGIYWPFEGLSASIITMIMELFIVALLQIFTCY